MTDTVVDGGAPAPVAPVGAPIDMNPVDVPNALGSQVPAVDKPEAKPEVPKTAGEAVRNAMEKVKVQQAAKEAEAKPAPAADAKPQPKDAKPAAQEPAKPAQERGADGKFATPPAQPDAGQKPQETGQQQNGQQPGHHEAPARFDAAAKAEWANAPESVKGAVHRAVRELEAGIEEHKQRWEPIRRYDDMAKQYGTDLPAALERYVAMDTALSEDLARGIDGILRDKTGGQMGLREFVAHLTGQQPDQAQSQNDATIHSLRQQITNLERQLGGVTTHIQSQAQRGVEADVAAFAQGKDDFEPLSDKIAAHIRAGKSLPDAYEAARNEAAELARSLGFVPASTQQQPLSPAPSPAPLKPAGQKSISGAPSSGSDPASMKKPPASSIREALERARARVA